jgi:hypothetical protein
MIGILECQGMEDEWEMVDRMLAVFSSGSLLHRFPGIF